MTPTQLAALALLTTAALAVIIIYIRTWRKVKLLLESEPKKTTTQESHRTPQKTATLLEISRRKHPQPNKDRLPKSFTNRPGVKQAQVNLKKTGYREDAKPEEEPKRRRH